MPAAKLIFISYSRTDKVPAVSLANKLRKERFDIWMDDKILGGTQWNQEIGHAIEKSDTMIVLLSPAAIESQYVDKEILHALNNKKTIVPVMLKKCNVPFIINTIQYVDFTSSPANGFIELVNSLNGDDSKPLPPPPPSLKKILIIALVVIAGAFFAFYFINRRNVLVTTDSSKPDTNTTKVDTPIIKDTAIVPPPPKTFSIAVSNKSLLKEIVGKIEAQTNLKYNSNGANFKIKLSFDATHFTYRPAEQNGQATYKLGPCYPKIFIDSNAGSDIKCCKIETGWYTEKSIAVSEANNQFNDYADQCYREQINNIIQCLKAKQ